ncbi:MAG: dehydratase [Leptospirales bacterium]|nr:dehydratase [Leptospirales bacterium]
MKRIAFNDYEVGAEIPELKSGVIQHMDLVRYAGASGDFNPIHTDPAFANQVGLGGTIAHGMYIMAMLGRLATNWAPAAQIDFFGVKFKGMSRPGQTIRCKGVVKKKKEENGKKILQVNIEAVADDGETKVSGELQIAAD